MADSSLLTPLWSAITAQRGGIVNDEISIPSCSWCCADVPNITDDAMDSLVQEEQLGASLKSLVLFGDVVFWSLPH